MHPYNLCAHTYSVRTVLLNKNRDYRFSAGAQKAARRYPLRAVQFALYSELEAARNPPGLQVPKTPPAQVHQQSKIRNSKKCEEDCIGVHESIPT
jgi:hypothetical protein